MKLVLAVLALASLLAGIAAGFALIFTQGWVR